MKLKFLKTISVAFVFVITAMTNIANAGLITDTSDDTFIDNTTGLEWMDFGVNDTHTYNEVESLLATTYQGWALASQSQVIELFDNAFGSFSQTNPHTNYYTNYSNNSNTNIMLDVFNVMGYGYDDGHGSLGWFADDQGGLSYAHFYRNAPSDAQSTNQRAYVYGNNVNFNNYRTSTSTYYSTMLVRTTAVPEPSTLAIFALGMIGLASRRFKKQSQ